MKIYNSLRDYLNDKQLSQRALAKTLGISPSYMNSLVLGARRPGAALAAEIEKVTGIPFRILLLPDSERSYTGPDRRKSA